ncbi:MAG: hypothetical protein LC687_05740 [Actinobacteria bacterium]|nr:hypothetical protein [Actinomycetota bacterium]
MGKLLDNTTLTFGFIAANLRELENDDRYSIYVSVGRYSGDINIHVYPEPEDDGLELVRQARKLVGPMEKKQSTYSGLYLKREIRNEDGSKLDISIQPPRGTCEQVEVGTKTVTKPDPAIEVPTIEVEEPVYEWECKELNGE